MEKPKKIVGEKHQEVAKDHYSRNQTQAVQSGKQPNFALQSFSAVQSGSKAKKEIGGPKGAREIGGPKGPEPTRYGDWERKGRCIDF